MSTMEQVEMDRYHTELMHDVEHLVNKYSRIMGWDIPDLDESAARQLLFAALHEAVAKAEAEAVK